MFQSHHNFIRQCRGVKHYLFLAYLVGNYETENIAQLQGVSYSDRERLAMTR